MRRFSLCASTAIGIAFGGILFNAAAAYADLPTIDVGAIAMMQMVKGVLDTVSSTINDVKAYASSIFSALGDNSFGSVQQLLQQGFTQNANYVKAQTGAMQQIADASNTANAQFALQVRNARIRDEHTVSPTACAALDGGVSTLSASVQGYDIGWTVANIHNARGEAQPGMPSYFGQAQGVASMSQQHLRFYCDQKDVDAGLCASMSQMPNADTRYASFAGMGTYANQDAINAAKDFAVNLIQPVAPAALRGDQLRSIQGQDAAVRRRSYDARMSVAQSIVDQQIGMQAPSVPITSMQQQYLTAMGLPTPARGNVSWLQALQIEAERRVGDVGWGSTLQASPPATVQREIAVELALTNYLLFQSLKVGLQQQAISAAHFAAVVQHDFLPTSQMPTPSMAAD